jgi:hypothetical protein
MGRERAEKPGHILFIASRLYARRLAAVALADRLARHGHRISFAAPPLDRPGTWPERAELYELEDYRLGGPSGPSVPFHRAFGLAARETRVRDALAQLPLDRTRALLQSGPYDLVLIDHELHPHIIAALGAGQRVALYADVYVGPAGPGAPPLSSALVPRPGHPMRDLRVWMEWLALWAGTGRQNLSQFLITGGVRYRDVLYRLARQEGVTLAPLVTTMRWLRPFEWYGLPMLILQPAEFDLPRRADPRRVCVGPQMQARATTERDTSGAIAIANAARAAGKRVIYIGFGSIMAQQPDLVSRLWRAVAARPNAVAIHSLGGNAQPGLPKPPENVHVLDWVPQRALLAETDVAVNHAGIGTILECLEAGVPMICFAQVNDQPGCAARVDYHGLGHSLSTSAGAEEIGAALDGLLKDAGYRDRTRAMWARFARYDTDRVAEHAVDRLMRGEV